MKHAVRTFVEGITHTSAAKAARGQVPATDLNKFIDLLGTVDWSVKERMIPPPPPSLAFGICRTHLQRPMRKVHAPSWMH